MNDNFDPAKIFSQEAKDTIGDGKQGHGSMFLGAVVLSVLLGFVILWPILVLFLARSWWAGLIALVYYGALVFTVRRIRELR